MARTLHTYLLLVFTTLTFKDAKASSEFTRSYHYKNVSIDCGQIYSDPLIPHILGFSLVELCKALHKQDLHIVINHNTDQPYYGYQFPNKTRYHWAIKYGTTLLKKHDLVSTDKPSIIIYYSGEFSIEEYKGIVYYAINHIEEIRTKQKLIDLPFYGNDKDTVVADKDISIAPNSADEANKILCNRELFIGDIYGVPNITYSYLNGTFHIIQYTGKIKYSLDPYKPINGKKLLSVNNIHEIIALPHDYLIYTSKHTFNDINRDDLTVTGPYTEPGYEHVIYYDYWGSRNYYDDGDKLTIDITTGNAEDNLTITFDKRTKQFTSTHMIAWLKRGFWPGYGGKNEVAGPSTVTTRTIEEKIPAYILLLAVTLNGIFIARFSRRSK